MRIRSIWHAIAIALVAAPGTAAAQLAQQVGDLKVTLSPARVNPANCGSTVRITVEATTNSTPVAGLEGSDRWAVAVTSGTNCGDAEEIDVGEFTAVTGTQGSYRTTVNAADLVEPVTGGSCSSITGTQRVNVCVIWDNSSGDDADARAPFSITDERPDAPVLTRVEPGDGRLRLSFEPEGDSSPDSWDVCYRELSDSGTAALTGGPFGGIGGTAGTVGGGGAGGTAGAGGTGAIGGAGGSGGIGGAGGSGGIGGAGGSGGAGGEGGTGGTGGGVPTGPDLCELGRVRSDISGSRRSFSLEGLRNGTTYEVAVRAIDDAGNASATSNVLEGTPQQVFDFLDMYKNAGGAEDGGCSSATGPAALGLLFSGLYLFRRRNGRR